MVPYATSLDSSSSGTPTSSGLIRSLILPFPHPSRGDNSAQLEDCREAGVKAPGTVPYRHKSPQCMVDPFPQGAKVQGWREHTPDKFQLQCSAGASEERRSGQEYPS